MELSFTVKTKELKGALRKISSLQGRSKSPDLNLSVYDDEIIIKVQGITQILKGDTKGMGDIIIPSKIIDAYLHTVSTALISFIFTEGKLECGTSVYNSPSIQVSQTLLKRVPDLPINLTPISILKICADKTAEQIKELGLEVKLLSAKRMVNKKINNAANELEDFNVTEEDLKILVYQKLQKLNLQKNC